MKRALLNLGVGTAFGVVLVRTGAADFDEMLRMFEFGSFHLFGVAIVTTLASAAALNALRRVGPRTVLTRAISWPRRPIHRGSVLGALIFGVGWAASGSCPGTVLAQVGQGHLIALSTGAGIVLGTVLFRVLNARYFKLTVSCE